MAFMEELKHELRVFQVNAARFLAQRGQSIISYWKLAR